MEYGAPIVLVYGNAWFRVSVDQPPHTRDDQDKKRCAQLQSGGARTGPFFGAAHGSVCGHLFDAGCMRRGAAHGSSCGHSFGVGHAAQGDAWELVRPLVRRGAHGREERQRAKEHGPVYSMAPSSICFMR